MASVNARGFAMRRDGVRSGITAAAAALLFACGPPPQEFATGTAIENVSVVDVDAGTVTAGRTVVVQGSRIAAVEPPGRLRLGGEVTRIDGGGGYLIPGLWDMHVHEFATGMPSALAVFIANGVTGVREMWGTVEAARDARDAIAAGDAIGPRAVAAGNITDGAPPWWPGSTVADTPERAREVVDSLADAGAGFVKVYSVLGADAFHAIAERAAERGLDVAGHVPFSVSAAAASDAGMRSMTHMFGIVEGCSSNGEEIRVRVNEWLALRAEGREYTRPFFNADLYRELLAEVDDELCGALLARMAANGTWITPTLAVLQSVSALHRLRDEDDPRQAYMSPLVLSGWNARQPGMAMESPEDVEAGERFFERQLAVTRMAAEAGVGVLAGTDTPNPFVYPGFSLHDELGLLVRAGFSPREALAAATTAPARFLGVADSLGAVETGRIADLVLLGANPLEDIEHTRAIEMVVANGRFMDRAALDAMLAEVRRARAEEG